MLTLSWLNMIKNIPTWHSKLGIASIAAACAEPMASVQNSDSLSWVHHEFTCALLQICLKLYFWIIPHKTNEMKSFTRPRMVKKTMLIDQISGRPCHLWCYVPLTNPKIPLRNMWGCTSSHNWTASFLFVKVLMNPRKAARKRYYKHQKRVEKRFMASWDENKWYHIWYDKVIKSYHTHWMVKSKLPNNHPAARKSLPLYERSVLTS